MAEKDKINEQSNSSTSIRNPSKEQIVTRLVQIRDYILKAEETLHGMSPCLRNDPKFIQLSDMISELRETEKRLMEMLRDESSSFQYRNPKKENEMETQPFLSTSSNNCAVAEDDFSMYGASSSSNGAFELFENRERDKLLSQRELLNKQPFASIRQIESLEGERTSKSSKAAAIETEIDKRLQLEFIRESSDSHSTRRCDSGAPMTDIVDTEEPDLNGRNLAEITGKRVEIHNIMSEIALLRRAKDESSRKIDLLQEALEGSGTSNPEKTMTTEFVPWTKERKEEEGEERKVPSQLTLSNPHECSDLAAECSEWSDSFQKSFSGKLLEIQAMREKLETLQNLVHSIPPSTSNYQLQSLDNELEQLERSSNGGPKDLNERINECRDRVYFPITGPKFTTNVQDNQFQSPLRSNMEFPMNLPVLRDLDRMLNSSEARGMEDDVSLPADLRNAFRNNEEFIQNLGNPSDSTSRRNSDYSSVGMDVEGIDGRRSGSISRVNKKSFHVPLDYRDGCDRLQHPKVNHNNPYSSSSSEPYGHSFIYKLQDNYNYSNPVLNSSTKSTSEQFDRIFPSTGSSDRIASLRSQKRASTSMHDKNAGIPDYSMEAGAWNWVSNRDGSTDNNLHRKYQSNNTAFTDRYMSETNLMLKHLVESISQISNDMNSQKSQMDILHMSVSKLTDRVEQLLHFERLGNGNDPRNFFTERNSSAPPNLTRPNPLRNQGSYHNDILGNENPSSFREFGYPLHPQQKEYSRDVLKGRHSHNTSMSSSSQQCNPLREIWGASANLTNNSTCSSMQQFREENFEQPINHTSASMHNIPNNAPSHNNHNNNNNSHNPRRWISPSSSSLWTQPQPMLNNNNSNNNSNNGQDRHNSASPGNTKRPWASPNPSSLGTALNNQVPPGTRTNNYWDNFRSQSRQNVLSSSSKSNESSNSVVSNPENPLPSLTTNNFNRREPILDKNPGKPIKGVMTHFVENIGSKKRNQEQQRQSLPQRSVSAGSIQHENGTIAGPSYRRTVNRVDEANNYSYCFGMNKPMRLDEYSALHPSNKFEHPEEPKLTRPLPHSERNLDNFTDMVQKVSQMKNEYLKLKTLDAVRKMVAQSIRQDEMTNGVSSNSNELFSPEIEMINSFSNNSNANNNNSSNSRAMGTFANGHARDNSDSPNVSQLNEPDLFGANNNNNSSSRASDNTNESICISDPFVSQSVTSFQAVHKSVAEAQRSNSVRSLTKKEDEASHLRQQKQEDHHEESDDCLLNDTISNSISACKGDSYFDYECDLDNGDSSSFQTVIVSTTPTRDLSETDLGLDPTLYSLNLDSSSRAAKIILESTSSDERPVPLSNFSSLLEGASNSGLQEERENDFSNSHYKRQVMSSTSNSSWTRDSEGTGDNKSIHEKEVRPLLQDPQAHNDMKTTTSQSQNGIELIPNENTEIRRGRGGNRNEEQISTDEGDNLPISP